VIGALDTEESRLKLVYCSTDMPLGAEHDTSSANDANVAATIVVFMGMAFLANVQA